MNDEKNDDKGDARTLQQYPFLYNIPAEKGSNNAFLLTKRRNKKKNNAYKKLRWKHNTELFWWLRIFERDALSNVGGGIIMSSLNFERMPESKTNNQSTFLTKKKAQGI